MPAKAKKPEKENEEEEVIEPKLKVIRVLERDEKVIESDLEEDIKQVEEQNSLEELKRFISPSSNDIHTGLLEERKTISLERGFAGTRRNSRDEEKNDNIKYELTTEGNGDKVYANIAPSEETIIAQSRGSFKTASEAEERKESYNTDFSTPARQMTHNRPDAGVMSDSDQARRDATAFQTSFQTGYDAEHLGKDSIAKAEKRKYQIK